MQYDVIVGNF